MALTESSGWTYPEEARRRDRKDGEFGHAPNRIDHLLRLLRGRDRRLRAQLACLCHARTWHGDVRHGRLPGLRGAGLRRGRSPVVGLSANTIAFAYALGAALLGLWLFVRYPS